MSNKSKKLLKFGVIAFGVLVLSSCTANFCTTEDQARIMYIYEGGDADDATPEFEHNPQLAKIIETAETSGIAVPSDDFFEAIDAKVLDKATQQAGPAYVGSHTEKELLEDFGYVKFYGAEGTLWGNYSEWVSELTLTLGVGHVPDRDFMDLYKKTVDTSYASFRACITLTDGNYGPNEEYYFHGKSWSFAFSKGIIEGLFVYPVAWLIESFYKLFGGSSGGVAQILAILFTTLIVRGILMAATFKSTMATQKMSLLQPDMAKLQAKYPNSNTNQYEKQQLAQAQMALYKKHGINPLSQIFVAIVQFPIFIAVWGAMTGSAILATGSFLGLNLNASVGTIITKNVFGPGWWTAVVLFILMAASQFVSMKMPAWINKDKNKKIVKTQANPAADSQQKQMKMMSNIMLIMVIVMGFSLPSAMGIYWFFGALISIAQTFITRAIMNKKGSKKDENFSR